MPSVEELARDLGRTFRERPALVVGAGAVGLIGLAVLNRRGSAEPEAEPVDPAAGLFPGVGTYGGSIPGSGSVPFAGYPVAGDGASLVPPDYAVPPPPPPLTFGLACNGVREPEPLGGAGAWTCTADGWRWQPADGWPPAGQRPGALQQRQPGRLS